VITSQYLILYNLILYTVPSRNNAMKFIGRLDLESWTEQKGGEEVGVQGSARTAPRSTRGQTMS
jgi:hypothetical protein